MFQKRIKRLFVITLITAAISFSILCQATEQPLSLDTIFAKYDGGEITKAKYDEEFDKIPVMYRSRFATLEEQEKFLTDIVLNEIIYTEAAKMGLDKSPEIIASFEENIEHFYFREYIRREITAKTILSEEEVLTFYNEHETRFTERPNTTIKYLVVDDEETAQTVQKEFEKGTDFIDLMNQYSTSNLAKRNLGFIRNIRSNGYIQGVGKDEELDNAIKEAELNKWNGPLHTENGYHFFMVTERIPSKLKPLEEVRSEIEGRLRPIKEYELKQKVSEELKNKYGIVIKDKELESLTVADLKVGMEGYDNVIISANNPELNLTIKNLHQNIQRISPQERAQLTNPEHLMRVVDRMLETHLFAFEAKIIGLEEYVKNDPDVEQIRRSIIMRAYFQKEITDYVNVPQADIEKFYQQNIKSYTIKERRTAQLFLYDTKKEAGKARRAVNKALKKSDDEIIKDIVKESLHTTNNGILSNVMKDVKTQVLGDDKTMIETLWNTELNGISKVLKNEGDKYFFIRIMEDNPSRIRGLEEVESDIRNRLSAALREERWLVVREELKNKYNVIIYPEMLALSLTAKELFDMAEDALQHKRFKETIQYYDRIIATFKNNDDDYKAHFMKAFLLAEEMKKEEEAITLFEELLKTYPRHDLHESAEFMIKSLRDGYNIFDD